MKHKDGYHRYDIICIGLGISGLYFGYKSMQSGKKILFLEKSDRVGGRIKSVELEKSKYYAEGCATRHFVNDNEKPSLINDGYIVNLLDKLNINSTALSNNSIKSNTNYNDVINNINSKYPDLSDEYAKYSFPNIVQSMNYSIDSFCDSIGYPVFKEPMNLNIALYTLKKFSNDTQYIINGGYESVCDKLYGIIKKSHKIKFNKSVYKISYKDGQYIVNDKYIAKKILFTGTINQMSNIIIDVPHLYKLKNDLSDNYFNYRAIRLYVQIECPWWNSSQISYKWNSGTPLNQILYYNPNTILIYSDMNSADILYNMIPDKYKHIDDFIKFSKVRILSEYVSKSLTPILGINNIKINKVWYKYTCDGTQFVKPIHECYSDFIENIQENNNFFMLSGDYTKNPGWVNSCLYLVEKKYKKILK